MKRPSNKAEGRRLRAVCLIVFLLGVSAGIAFAGDKENLKKEMSRLAMTAKDIIYRSPHGYSILVPAGYEYRPSNQPAYSGILSLVAIKDHGNNRKSVVTVLVSDSGEPTPEEELEEICKEIKAENETAIFSRTITGRDKNKVRRDYRCMVKGYNLQGIVVVLFKNNRIYQLGLQSYAFDKARADFERITASFQ